MNGVLGEHPQTFIVGSFEESILLAYQKSRTGDIIFYPQVMKALTFLEIMMRG